jgi:hypothetical protein
MNTRDVIRYTALSMLITCVVLGSFVAGVPVDAGSKVLAVLVPVGITGLISAGLCFAYMHLRKR